MNRIDKIQNLFYLTLLLVTTTLLLIILISVNAKSSALSGSEFNPGHIIDDTVFYNQGSMSVAQIQQFLNSKVPVCDTNGSKMYNASQTRAQWAVANGRPQAPYTCLKDYSQTVQTTINSGSDLCTNSIQGGTKSAAQIIYDVSQACGINSQVLIVLLQKEQSLITDDWPWPRQYEIATGYGCPDTAPCASEYYGFFNQVYQAAKAFRRYESNPDSFNYKANRNNFIYYNPNLSGCGGSSVFIQNQATANLYIYTPYQPNAAALNNLYGTGDSCSAYGNRNFWRMFNDWFGSTNGSPFFRVQNDGRVYISGANNTYYHVPEERIMQAYGYGTQFNTISIVNSSYLSERTYQGTLPWIARFEGGPSIYQFETNGLHHFETPEMYAAFGNSFGDEAVLPSYLEYRFQKSTAMANIVRQFNGAEIYNVVSGTKRHITTPGAFSSEGAPPYITRPVVITSRDYMNTLPNGAPILETGQIVRSSDNGSLYAWMGTELTQLSGNTLLNGGFPATYQTTSNLLSLLPQSAQPLSSQLIENASGQLYLIDRGSAYSLNSEQRGLLQTSMPIVPVPSRLLNNFRQPRLSSAMRQISQPEVKVIRNGSLYNVYSEQDFSGLGINSSEISILTVDPSILFSDTDQNIFAPGRLIRSNISPKIYLTNENFKLHHITTEEMLVSQYGFSFNKVAVVAPTSVSAYTEDRPLGFYIERTSAPGEPWLVDQGCKRFIKSDLFSAYGQPQTNTNILANNIFDSIPICSGVTYVFRPQGSPKVYFLQNGQKRWVTNESAFIRNGFFGADVRILSQSFANTLPDGPIINN